MPVWSPWARRLAFFIARSTEGDSNEEMGEIGDGMDPEDRKLTEDSMDWRELYDDLDMRVIGTLSKGRDARLSLAAVSVSGDHLYAFVRENALGNLEDCTRIDDA